MPFSQVEFGMEIISIADIHYLHTHCFGNIHFVYKHNLVLGCYLDFDWLTLSRSLPSAVGARVLKVWAFRLNRTFLTVSVLPWG